VRRENVTSGTMWESRVGYSRTVCRGLFVYVSGTTATAMGVAGSSGGRRLGADVSGLEQREVGARGSGAGFANVVRTRIFVLHIDD
jgi:enamine deaminase RidA (YjgF/YER057c/UK114 family)